MSGSNKMKDGNNQSVLATSATFPPVNSSDAIKVASIFGSVFATISGGLGLSNFSACVGTVPVPVNIMPAQGLNGRSKSNFAAYSEGLVGSGGIFGLPKTVLTPVYPLAVLPDAQVVKSDSAVLDRFAAGGFSA